MADHEHSPSATDIVPVDRLVGLDIADAETALADIRGREAELVVASLPTGAVMIDPNAPEESLVIRPAAINYERTTDEGSGRRILLRYQGELYEGSPQHNEGVVRTMGGQGGPRSFHDSSPTEGIRRYRYYIHGDEKHGYSRQSHAISPKVTSAWGFSLEELEARETVEAALAEQNERFVAGHPLGEGALIITNRYGGIDPTNPAATTRSLLTRFIYANQLHVPNELGSFGDHAPLVQHGLVDPNVMAIAGQGILELREAINPSLTIIEQMQAAGGDVSQVMPAVESLVQTHVQAFLDEYGQKLLLGAQLLRNPDESTSVVKAVLGARRFTD